MLVNGEKVTVIDNETENENEKVNVNEGSFKRRFRVNNKKTRKAKLCSDAEAESGAERYIQILNAPECREFFLKVMYHLPYDTREHILEKATRTGVGSPAHYFTYCAKRELTLLGF